MEYNVTAVYWFSPSTEEEVKSRVEALRSFGEEDPTFCGLILVSPEGLNGTLAGSKERIEEFKNLLRELTGDEDIVFKDSFCEFKPYRRFKVKEKEEIVTFDKELVPPGTENSHLSPEEWDRVLKEEDVVLIDTRNDYEVAVGKFKGAIDPEIQKFTQFRDYVKNSGIPKDKKVLMYCTGGIRCEKAILEMHDQGYENVFQLEGGILKYLEEYPGEEYEGECFVFDHRVALDQNLEPSKQYKLCPHCGDPGCTKVKCEYCGSEAVVCQSCLDSDSSHKSCSKNCAHHVARGTQVSKNAA